MTQSTADWLCDELGRTGFILIVHSGPEAGFFNRRYRERGDLPKKDRREWERRWIPVSERFPEDGQWVAFIAGHSPRAGKREGDILRGGSVLDGTTYLEDVTHWMPLPEAP